MSSYARLTPNGAVIQIPSWTSQAGQRSGCFSPYVASLPRSDNATETRRDDLVVLRHHLESERGERAVVRRGRPAVGGEIRLDQLDIGEAAALGPTPCSGQHLGG